jgi:hypothetical protein
VDERQQVFGMPTKKLSAVPGRHQGANEHALGFSCTPSYRGFDDGLGGQLTTCAKLGGATSRGSVAGVQNQSTIKIGFNGGPARDLVTGWIVTLLNERVPSTDAARTER